MKTDKRQTYLIKMLSLCVIMLTYINIYVYNTPVVLPDVYLSLTKSSRNLTDLPHTLRNYINWKTCYIINPD